ncbi:Tumour necrosis factor receptor superfamily member 19 [Paenibacillus tarimensis]
MSVNFIIIMTVMVLFVLAILTSSYNDDKTKGL